VTNDVPVLPGTSPFPYTTLFRSDGAGNLTTGGALTIADVDQGQSNFAPQAAAAGSYGTFTLDAAGNWTYTASDSQTAVQQLGAGERLSDRLDSSHVDGTASETGT